MAGSAFLISLMISSFLICLPWLSFLLCLALVWFVEIIISDSGVGISKEMQSKLFDISENTSTQGTENESGTGLGLILCKGCFFRWYAASW